MSRVETFDATQADLFANLSNLSRSTRSVRASGCAALCLILAMGCGHMGVGSHATPIAHDEDDALQVPRGVGAPHAPRPLAAPEVPEHPYMAQHGASCMHVDPYTTNTYEWSGPLGHDPEVTSRSMGYIGGECPTHNFDQQGRMVTVCVRQRSPTLLLLDPNTLQVLAAHSLPTRRTPLFGVRAMTEDTSGGAYFYLDDQDRAVVGTGDGTIAVIGVVEGQDGPRFALERRIALQRELRLPDGSLDKLTAVMPDFQGNYWFVARYGTVGVVTPGGTVKARRLEGEEIENSFSVAEDGVYIVSDHALYRFEVGRRGQPQVVWRETYDRGTRRKVGQINQGSGTTPTLLGDDYVAIADNAEPRMNVLVYRRGREHTNHRRVCATPVFTDGESATENTLIGHGRSLVVENNAGYDIFSTMQDGRTSAPGLARVDIREDESGCDITWESSEISQTTVPKLSTATGLIYLYTKLPDAPGGVDAYYFTAIDFETGRTAYSVLTGTGMRYDNHWAAITLSADGTAYVGVLNGLIRVRDRETALSARTPTPTF